MAYSDRLARIKTILEGVTDIGKVHDNVRHILFENTFQDEYLKVIGGQSQVRAWIITREGGGQHYGSVGRMGGTKLIIPAGKQLLRDDIVIEGFLALLDNATEKIFQALVDSVLVAFEDDITLNNTALERSGIEFTIDDIELSEVLCHHVTIKFSTEVITTITPS